MNNAALSILCLSSVFVACTSLECLICKDQENNFDKCVKTMKTCEQGEDTCMTEVKWGTMPYWQQGADKQHYITKSCSTKVACERARNRSMPYCTHIWYEDWKCTECCQGDRCNYYVILGASTARSNLLTTAVCVATAVLAFFRVF